MSGSWGWEEPSPADEEPSFPVPRHSSGALGTVCCRAGGEGAVDGSQQLLSRAGARANKALGWMCRGRDRGTRAEPGRGFWQCSGAGRCRGAHKQMQREGKIKRSKVGCGDKHQRQSSENKSRAPTYGASTGARLTPRGVMTLLCTVSLLSFLAIFHQSWKWDPALSAFQSVSCCGTTTGKQETPATTSLLFLFLSTCQD